MTTIVPPGALEEMARELVGEEVVLVSTRVADHRTLTGRTGIVTRIDPATWTWSVRFGDRIVELGPEDVFRLRRLGHAPMSSASPSRRATARIRSNARLRSSPTRSAVQR